MHNPAALPVQDPAIAATASSITLLLTNLKSNFEKVLKVDSNKPTFYQNLQPETHLIR